ncbi:hypothetical protein G9272_00670 [Streptomyces asoensis]|uniref:Uncharacterized protein n=1 Tax=Streptomyces asoensis TaxID=249586 RepID=A0A6M4WIP0_9ACTN|nr:hypothetical protein [Streptomyces asoensis]QJS99034.1 hypothetical protein G9272_00670 [Streptomyces asoensis]
METSRGGAVGGEEAAGRSEIGLAEFALRVLRQVAPDEVAAFEADMPDHLRRARAQLRREDRGRERDIACGSGIGLVDVMAPAVVFVCVALGQALTEGVTKPLADATGRSVTRLLSRLLRRPTEAEAVIRSGSFSAEQLTAIHVKALAEAQRMLPYEHAKAVADAVVTCLVVEEGT